MRLLTVPSRQGIAWLRQGFAIFVRQPLAFSVLFALFMTALFVAMLLPVVGALLLLAVLPLATLGFMVATRSAVAGGPVTPRAFAEPLQQGRPRTLAMLKLGVAYAAASAVGVTLAGWIDGGALDEAMDALASANGNPVEAAQRFADPRVELGLIARLAIAALLAVPFWHAPALIHWGGQGVAQSLFSSTVAIWRNKGAFSVYALAWTGLVVGFGVGALLLFGLLGMPQLAAFALMPATLLFSTVFYVSLWFTFADCFGTARGDDPSSDHPITKDTP
jgi:hypothetical protein